MDELASQPPSQLLPRLCFLILRKSVFWLIALQPLGHAKKLSGVYAASKGALSTVSEILRLELAPLGVNVVTVETGAVRSRGQINLPELKLPSSSRYLSIEKTIAARARGEDGVSRMETRAYAAQVVDDVLNGTRGRIWRGGTALLVRFASALIPAFLLVSHLVKRIEEKKMTGRFPGHDWICLQVNLGWLGFERERVGCYQVSCNLIRIQSYSTRTRNGNEG